MESPLALYRRYRPETFAEVIGQDHVTEPLRAALAGNRVSHAYLFSGPRGCGKTTSARILARSLNCEQAPVADPCGECDSCRDLARGGPGSIDVIEIDAASHGGVDDARDLREKAFFAPVRSRFKVYIIDEAHMVSTQGFNALLKLVEEPPPHLRFIFATTEPEKVIPTIRSRTHHYPFRLIPPRLLTAYLSDLCELEQVTIEPAALPLVVRAGAGSARDTLSVLDQLMGGAGAAGITYALASGLLGYTPDTLLDEVVDAFAAGDGGAVFAVVDKVIETGQDPRRFTEDLLRRLRDLVIVSAVPDAPASGLIDIAEDAAERLVAQAARFGPADLSRAADLVATGLTEMRGATAPRLLLELICARVLLPGADHSTGGVMARLDRLERRMTITGGDPSPAPTVATEPASVQAGAPHRRAHGDRAGPARCPGRRRASRPPTSRPLSSRPPSSPPTSRPHSPPGPDRRAGRAGHRRRAGSTLTLVDVRRLWPDIVEATKQRRRITWIYLTQQAQVIAVDDATLTLGFANAGARDSFDQGGSGEIVRQAAIDVVGHDWRVETIVDPGAEPATSVPPRRAPEPATPSPEPVTQAPDWARPEGTPPDATPTDTTTTEGTPPETTTTEDAPSEHPSASAREAIAASRGAGPAAPAEPAEPDDGARPDDTDAESSGLDGAQLLEEALGAQVIEQIPHQ